MALIIQLMVLLIPFFIFWTDNETNYTYNRHIYI
jgi:hypothetical protein